MKSVLVPIEDHNSMTAVLETARQAATALSANLHAIPLRAMQFQVVGAEPIVAVSFPPADQDDEDASARARGIFNSFVGGLESTGAPIVLDRLVTGQHHGVEPVVRIGTSMPDVGILNGFSLNYFTG